MRGVIAPKLYPALFFFKNMKIKHIFVSSILSLICIAQAIAQDNALLKRYAMFSPSHIPTSHALAYRWQMRIDFSNQFFIKQSVRPKTDAQSNFMASKLTRCNDWRLGLSLTPWNRITHGTALSISYRKWFYASPTFNDVDKAAYITHYMIELFGSFHDTFGERFAYETRYTFYANDVDITSNPLHTINNVAYHSTPLSSHRYLGEYGDLKGAMLCHSVTGGLSMFNKNRSLQGTIQLNAEFMHYLKQKYIFPYMLSEITQLTKQDRGRLFLMPAILCAWHAPKIFSIQLHVGLPMAVIKGNVYAPCPSWGIQLSFRTIKTGRRPTPTEINE